MPSLELANGFQSDAKANAITSSCCCFTLISFESSPVNSPIEAFRTIAVRKSVASCFCIVLWVEATEAARIFNTLDIDFESYGEYFFEKMYH